MTDGLFDGV